MTRFHIIAVSMMFGFIAGVAAPVHAASYGAGITHTPVTIDEVDSNYCTITASGTEYTFADCDDADSFEEGDFATLEQDTDQGFTVLISSNGDEIEVSE